MRPEPVQGAALASGDVAPCTPGGRPASWAATGRSGGVSRPPYGSLNLASHVGDDPDAVMANRDIARDLVGAAGVAVAGAVHGSRAALASEPGEIAGVDAVISRTPGLAAVALGADCLVMGLIGDDDLSLAAVHCGWRGLVADVTGSTVAALGDLGVGVHHVVLGPAVCGACYPVPPERAEEVRDTCSPAVAAAALVICRDGQPGIDVRRGVIARLAELGLTAVTSVDICTVEDARLFSHRRDGVTGRQGIVLVR